jgi:hypothetical protein
VAFLLGPVRGPAFLESRGLAALIVGKDDAQVAVGRWPLPVHRFDPSVAGRIPS